MMETEAVVELKETSTLPDGWAWRTLDEVSEVVGGATPKTGEPENYEGGTIAWLTPADLSGYTDKYIQRGARFITKKGLESCSTKLLPKGTVLFTSRAPIGYVAIASDEVCTNQGFKSFVVDEAQVTPDYVYWWLKGAKAIAEEVASGTTFLELSTAKAKKLPIPVAPLPQQRRIVEAIELQLGRLDAAVARLQGAKARLKRYKQAVLKAAVEGRLFNKDLFEGELPEDWSWTTLGEAVELVSGGTPKGLNESAIGGTIPFFKVGDMTLDGNDRYMETSRTYLTPAEANRLKLTIHPAGTVIFPKRGGAILTNKKRVLSGPGAFDLNLMGAIPNDQIDGGFLFYWFEKLDLSKIYDGSNIPQINKKNVDPLPFAKPPLKEQRRIADELDRLLSSSDETETTLDAQLQQAVRLRQAVLKRAFEGRLG